jgi:serine protease Do
MSLMFTKPRIAAVAGVAFVTGVFFASTMDWTRLAGAQAKVAAKQLTTEVQGLADQQNAFVAIAEHVTPAVVSIQAERDARPADRGQRRQVPPGMEEFFDQLDPRQRTQESSGSGFIVSHDGYILTNNHVVDGADRVTVGLLDHRTFKARVIGRDAQTDVAVIKIDAKDLPNLPLGDDSKVRVGEWAVAIGNPLGLDFTVTAGIISAKGRSSQLSGLNRNTYAIQDFLQTDAAINPGNSGGPLVNIRGEVIGINSAIASQTGFYSGYGFAIPITLAKTVMDDIIAHGRVRRAIMGVLINEVTPEDAAVAKLKDIAGVKLGGFNPPEDSPAERAGLQPGDIVVKADGRPVDRVSTLQRIIRTKQPGDVVELEAVRYGEHRTFRVKLVEAPSDEKAVALAARPEAADETSGRVNVKKLGVTVEALSAEFVKANLIPESKRGLVVREIENGTSAKNQGMLAGDIIVEVIFPEPKTPIRGAADLQKALGRVRDGEIVGLMLFRGDGKGGGNTRVVNVRVGG